MAEDGGLAEVVAAATVPAQMEAAGSERQEPQVTTS